MPPSVSTFAVSRSQEGKQARPIWMSSAAGRLAAIGTEAVRTGMAITSHLFNLCISIAGAAGIKNRSENTLPHDKDRCPWWRA